MVVFSTSTERIMIMSKTQFIKAITNCNIVLEGGILWDGTLIIEGDRIAAFGESRVTEIPEGAEVIDAGEKYLGPGLVDIHVHGGGGYDTYVEPEVCEMHFLRHGETSILPTPPYDLDKNGFLNAIRTLKEYMPRAKTIKGINFEGPYTNPRFGSHAYMNPWNKPISEEDFKPIVDEAGELATIWSVAPELEGIMPFLKYARKVNPNTIFSIGHSEATPKQIRDMGRFRPRLMTHIMNATGRLPAPGGTRSFGPDEYALKEPEVYAEMISDSMPVHLPADLQRYVLKAKSVDRVILITDSTYYETEPPEHLRHVTDLSFDEHGGLAGSRMTMDKACRNIMKHTSCGIAEAFLMASTNPARLIGLDGEIGSIDVGKIADLIIVDDKFNVDTVILGGEICKF